MKQKSLLMAMQQHHFSSAVGPRWARRFSFCLLVLVLVLIPHRQSSGPGAGSFCTAFNVPARHHRVVVTRPHKVSNSEAHSHVRTSRRTVRHNDYPVQQQQHRHYHFNHPRRRDISLQQSHHAILDVVLRPHQALNTIMAACAVKFLSQWRTYSLIPVIAALVGWFTNYLAVKMSTFCVTFHIACVLYHSVWR